MVFKLYGFPTSTATRRAAQILHEKRVPFEFIVLDRASNQQKDPGYLAKHPFGQVPTIDDDGFILYESRAICRYIATKWADVGAPLIPTDPQGKALFEQAASVEESNFDPYAVRIAFEKIMKPARGLGPTDEAAVEAAAKTLRANLDVYEVFLGKSKYLIGDEPTLVDFFHLPFGTHVLNTDVDILSNRPNFARWFKDISNWPSWVAVKDGVESKLSY